MRNVVLAAGVIAAASTASSSDFYIDRGGDIAFDSEKVLRTDQAQIDTLRIVEFTGSMIDGQLDASGLCKRSCRILDGEGGLKRWEIDGNRTSLLIILYPNYRGDYTDHIDIYYMTSSKASSPELFEGLKGILGVLQFPNAKEPLRQEDIAESAYRWISRGPKPYDDTDWLPGLPLPNANEIETTWSYSYISKNKPMRFPSYTEPGVLRPPNVITDSRPQ